MAARGMPHYALDEGRRVDRDGEHVYAKSAQSIGRARVGGRHGVRACLRFVLAVFFFNDTATTEIYPLSLHDALPISEGAAGRVGREVDGLGPAERRRVGELVLALDRDLPGGVPGRLGERVLGDRKSTRRNRSHLRGAYAVFCSDKSIGRARVEGLHVLRA